MPVATRSNANLSDKLSNYFYLKKLVPFFEVSVRSAEKNLSPAEGLYEACSHIPNVCTITPEELETIINDNHFKQQYLIDHFSLIIMNKDYYEKYYKPIDTLVINMLKNNQLDKAQLDNAFSKLKGSHNTEEVKHYDDMERSGIKQFTYDLFALYSNQRAHISAGKHKVPAEEIQARLCVNNGEHAAKPISHHSEELINDIVSEA
jgi:hypothetical protein